MAFISLKIFGPAEGFRAFSVTPGSVTADFSDQLALSGAELELGEGSEAYRLIQTKGPSGNCSYEVSIFRQIYEQRSKRLGHSCGASIVFEGCAPSGVDLTYFLRTIISELLATCCSEQGAFSNLNDLQAFCQTVMNGIEEAVIPKFSHAPYDLETSTSLGIHNPSQSFAINVPGVGIDSHVADALDEIFSNIGSVIVGRVIFFDGKNSALTARYPVVATPRDIERKAYEHILSAFVTLGESVRQWKGRADASMESTRELSEQNLMLSNDLAREVQNSKNLEAHVNDLNEKLQASLQNIKNISGNLQPAPQRADSHHSGASLEIRNSLLAIDKNIKLLTNRIPEPRDLLSDVITWILVAVLASAIVFVMTLLALLLSR
jgi:hypothetical protein